MEKKKIDLKKLTKNTLEEAKEKYEEAKKFTSEKAVPKLKETAVSTKNKVATTASNVSNKVKTSITEEQVEEILNTLYIKSVNGIPKISLPIDDLVNDYMSKNKDIDSAAKSLINNSMVKCGTSGFLTGLGGLATMVATLPANITSVMYVQLRMCCAVAKMAGYDIHSDQSANINIRLFNRLSGSGYSKTNGNKVW